MTTAIILAGSRGGGDTVAQAAGVPHKALAPVAGRPMIGHVAACLAALPDIDRLIVVGAPLLAAHLPPTAEVRPPDRSPALSLLAVMKRLPTSAYPLLVTTADHPLLTPAMVAHFQAHLPSTCAAAVAVARADNVEQAARGSRRTFWGFADGRYCGCNLFALTTPDAADVVAYWRRLEDERKRPWRMVKHLGAVVLARFALGYLSLDEATNVLGARVGLPLAAVELPFGEAAVDVDRPQDLLVAERLLTARASGASEPRL